MKSAHADKNRMVAEWWNEHPFAYGVSNRNRDQVGTIPLEQMDLAYFEEIERRFRKHSRGAGQEDGAPLLSKLVDYRWLRGKRVLDIAVGSGFSMVAFIQGGARVTGIDITPFAVAHTKKNLETRGLSGEVYEMDAQAMAFPNEMFDFVNAWGCLMHMPDTERAIREIRRVLRPKGKCLAYMYNKHSWPYWFNIVFLRGVVLGGLVRYRGDAVRLASRYTDGASVGGNQLTKFYAPKEIEAMFWRAGFASVKVFPLNIAHEPDHWPMRLFPVFKYLPRKVKAHMSKRWGYGLIVQAGK